MRYLIFILFTALSLISAQASSLEEQMSTALKALLATNAPSRKALDKVISELPTGTELRLTYFRSASESEPLSTHGYFPSGIIVSLRADQQPWDEFICLYFEIANSLSRKRFEALVDEAKSGAIARDKFPIEGLRIEFAAVKRTRDVIKSLSISTDEQLASYSYTRLSGCPDNFDDFLAYRQRVSPKRDPIGFYKELYDKLQRKQ